MSPRLNAVDGRCVLNQLCSSHCGNIDELNCAILDGDTDHLTGRVERDAIAAAIETDRILHLPIAHVPQVDDARYVDGSNHVRRRRERC